MIAEDIKRLIRHLVPVAVTIAVSQGWLPAEAQAPAIEAGIIAATLLFSLAWSHKRDKVKNKQGD